jgi:hypothetical protein
LAVLERGPTCCRSQLPGPRALRPCQFQRPSKKRVCGKHSVRPSAFQEYLCFGTRSVSAAHQTLRPCSARATTSEVTNSSESVLSRSRSNVVNTTPPGKMPGAGARAAKYRRSQMISKLRPQLRQKANEFLFECRRRQVCQGILQASPAAPVRDRSFKGVMSTVNATSAGPRRGSPRLRPSSLGERESGTAVGRGRRLPRSLKGIYPPRAPLEWAGTQSCPNLAPST